MREVTLRQRYRYWFDNLVSRGSGALIGMLAATSAVAITVLALVVWATGISPKEAELDEGVTGLVELMWMGLMRTIDAGTVAGDKGGPWFLGAMFAFTIWGIFVFSSFIGLLTSGIENKIGELRKGRSLVIETDHVLILGWSTKIFTILDQLIEANQSHPKPRIVILADKDKVEMEDEIRARVRPPGRVKVICRTGSPIDIGDLEIVNADEARAIVVMSPEDDDPDAGAIKSILALVNRADRPKKKYHIVAELKDRRNIEVVEMVAGDEAETIDSSLLIARMMVQTCRQSGLSVVYSDLLDFGGVEIYFRNEPSLVGKTFGEAQLAYEGSSVIGLRRADGSSKLNAPNDTSIRQGDSLIVISEDDSAIALSGSLDSLVDKDAIRSAAEHAHKPERTLVLGWNGRGPLIVNELDKYVAPESELTIVADMGDLQGDLQAQCGGVKNLRVSHEVADTTSRAVLDRLNIPSYDHVILLCYRDDLEPQKADARTLVSLLHMRRISEQSGVPFSIVSEMLDVRNRELAESPRADDFIVSDRLVSLMMAQVAESKDLNVVFEDLFDPEGCEVYLNPAEEYVVLDKPVTFATVVAAARDKGHAAFGYRVIKASAARAHAHGVVLNPPKSQKVTFKAGDKIIVLAED